MRFRAIILCVAACLITTEGLPRSGSSASTSHVCTSTKCKDLAFELSKTVDPSADPCTDFYKFVCGGVGKSDSDYVPVDNKKIFQDKMREGIKQLVGAGIEPNEPRPFKLVKTFYKSCMNTEAIEAIGLEPFRQHLRSLGGWPLVEGDSWNGEKFDWRRTIYKFPFEGKNVAWHFEHKLGYLIDFDVEITTSRRRITMVRPSVGLIQPGMTKNALLNDKSFIDSYYMPMTQMAWMLGADVLRTVDEISAMLSFEIKLSQIIYESLNTKPLTKYNLMSIAQLEAVYPSVPWMTYIRNFVPSHGTVTDDEVINVPDPEYYVKLEALMATISKRVQANYVMSRVAMINAAFSTKAMREIVHLMLGKPKDCPVDGDRADYCESLMMGHLWRGAIVMYASKVLDRNHVIAIASDIKSQLEKRIRSYNWADQWEKMVAMEKAAGLVTHVDYEDTFLNLTNLGETYGNLEFTEFDFFGNMNSLSNYDHDLGSKVLTESFDVVKSLFVKSRALDQTRYIMTKNVIVITRSSFRYKFFGKNQPRYVNYGLVGNLIGHEMTHALLDRGYYRGSDGKLTRYQGLRFKPEFRGRAQCLINQYGNYHKDNNGTTVDGRKSLVENIADVGGVRLAYDAYANSAAGQHEEPKLPTFEKYSAKQMFWIILGSNRCSKIQQNNIPPNIHVRERHSSPKFRVIGSFANMPEFAEDFHCTATSLMNPVKRCDVW